MGTTASGQNRADPRFTDAQLAALRGYGQRRQVPAGQIMYSPRDDHNDLFVVAGT